MIPANPNTEDKNSQEPSTIICQRESCIHKGTKYSEATRRCTIQLTQKTDFPITLNGLHFSSDRITVDLCVICYHYAIKRDEIFKILSVVGVGSYAEKRA